MEPSAASEPRLDHLRKLVDEKDFEALESAWMELVEDAEAAARALESLLEVARDLVEGGYSSRAGILLELLLDAVGTERLEPDKALELHWMLLRLFPEKEEYRTSFVESFEDVHPLGSPERAFLDACGIRATGDCRRALDELEKLLAFLPGACVYHPAGWGVGEVLGVDGLLKQVRVDLEHKRNHRIAIDAVHSILERLPDDSFRALKYRGGQELRRLAAEDRPSLVEKVLADFGNPLPLKQLKGHLVPDVVSPAAWSKWWSGAKRSLRDSGFFRIEDRSPYRVEKLESAIRYEDDLVARFRGGDPAVRRRVARQVLRGGARKYPEAISTIRAETLRLAFETENVPEALEAALLLSRRDAEDEASAGALDRVVDRFAPAELLEGLEGVTQTEEAARILDAISRLKPDVVDEVLQAAFLARSDASRDAAVARLEEKDPSRLRALGEELLRSPRLGPEAVCWLVERRLEGKSSPVVDAMASLSDAEVVGMIFDLLDHLVDRNARTSRVDPRLRDALRRVEDILFRDKGRFFRRIVEQADREWLRGIHAQLVRSSDDLPRHPVKLLEILTTAEPGLLSRRRGTHEWWDEDAIYVTEKGLARRREEFRVLTEEKIPRNFEAVGKAADLGDLSENAEFTSALEEQGHLTRRASLLQEELEKARVIRPEDVRPGRVGLGSRVRVRDLDTGEELVYSILGPWDGLPEEGVLNYLSPLGKFFLGKREGEEFVAELPVGDKRYRVLEVGSHYP